MAAELGQARSLPSRFITKVTAQWQEGERRDALGQPGVGASPVPPPRAPQPRGSKRSAHPISEMGGGLIIPSRVSLVTSSLPLRINPSS